MATGSYRSPHPLLGIAAPFTGTAGYTSLCAIWMGGACALGTPIPPQPPDQRIVIDADGWLPRKPQHDIPFTDEELCEVLNAIMPHL